MVDSQHAQQIMAPPESSFFDFNYAKAATGLVHQVVESGYCGGLSPLVVQAEQRIQATFLQPSRLVANGTVALELALRTLGVQANEKVICSARSFVATANAILTLGAIPIFVDQESTGIGMDPDALLAALNAHPDARTVMIAHIYGLAPTLREIVRICDQRGCHLIEDAAQSFGRQLDGRALGTWGRLGTFSFFSNKTLACGEGGCIVAKRHEDVRLIEELRYHGAYIDEDGQFIPRRSGTNARIGAFAAAILCSQLDNWTSNLAKRQDIANAYCRGIQERTRDFRFCAETDLMPPPIWCAVLRQSNGRGWPPDVAAHLARLFQRQGVACRPGMPWLNELAHLKQFEMVLSRQQGKQEVELLFPIHQGMDEASVSRVLDLIFATLSAATY